jgi:hypothetical protein
MLSCSTVVTNSASFLGGHWFTDWTAEGLAEQVTPEHIEKGLIYPPFSIIRKISANIAARVAAKAYDLGIFAVLGCFLLEHLTAWRHHVSSILLLHFPQEWLASSLGQKTW